MLMELKYNNDVYFHINSWWWGKSIDIIKDDGTAIVCVKYDKNTFPKTGYICALSVLETERKKGIGDKMMRYALMSCADNRMTSLAYTLMQRTFGYVNGTSVLGSRNFQGTRMRWKWLWSYKAYGTKERKNLL